MDWPDADRNALLDSVARAVAVSPSPLSIASKMQNFESFQVGAVAGTRRDERYQAAHHHTARLGVGFAVPVRAHGAEVGCILLAGHGRLREDHTDVAGDQIGSQQAHQDKNQRVWQDCTARIYQDVASRAGGVLAHVHQVYCVWERKASAVQDQHRRFASVPGKRFHAAHTQGRPATQLVRRGLSTNAGDACDVDANHAAHSTKTQHEHNTHQA